MSNTTTFFRGSRRGAALVQMVMCLTAVMGIMAVTLDGGTLLMQRRCVQAAADAAALSGAVDLFQNWKANQGADTTGSAKTSALTTAFNNGYPNADVTVNIPPKTGDHVGAVGFVEVLITYPQPRYFSLLWGTANISVGARAVASGGYNAPGMLLLGTTGTTLSGNGTTSIDATSGAIIANSTGLPSVVDTVPALTATQFDFTANQADTSSGSATFSLPSDATATPNYNQIPTPDPLANLPVPSIPAAPVGNTSTTLNQGNYPNGIGSGNWTLNPGLYYITGGITLKGNDSITGTGVFLYFTGIASGGSAISLQGNATISLTPETTGTYQYISIFVDRSFTGTAISLGGGGNNKTSMNIQGTIYAPNAALDLNGHPGFDAGAQIIASSVSLKGNSAVTVGGGPVAYVGRSVYLVE